MKTLPVNEEEEVAVTCITRNPPHNCKNTREASITGPVRNVPVQLEQYVTSSVFG